MAIALNGLSGHGGNVWAAARFLECDPSALLDLSTNTFSRMEDRTAALLAEDPEGETAGGRWALRYPDPHACGVRAALAAAEGVPAEQVLAGNGASELIWAALGSLRPRKAFFLGPLFAEYARACRALGVAWDVLTPPEAGTDPCSAGGFAPDAGTLRRIAATDADVVVACSPNNPGTAVLLDPEPLLKAAGGRTLLLDASYKDFLPGRGAADSPPFRETHSFPFLSPLAAAARCRLILIGSLTKFYCCPGVRLGFLISGEDTVRRIAGAVPPWTVSTFAARAGMRLLAQRGEYAAALPALRRDVADLAAGLEQSGLFRVVLPGVSFVTAALREPGRAESIRTRLLTRRKVLIRVCDNIPGMPAGFVRIQARPPEHLVPLWEGLRDFPV
jgi:threonine-phosphate decarboxylase